MNLREAMKKYFSKYNDDDEEEKKKKKKKKKKKIAAGSYSKTARKGYETALEEADNY